MLSLELDMVQYDCPYIDTTVATDVSFYAKQWDFNPAEQVLETRVMVNGADPEALGNGLATFQAHEHAEGYELIKREGNVALIRSRIAQTDAMSTIRDHDGYITGPFDIADGSEIWHVGFDRSDVADGALAALSRNNDFTVRSREAIDLEDYYDLMANVDTATSLLEGCRDLSTVERETLQAAVADGYFTSPREATLSTLASDFDVSKTAISERLRRAQRKVLEPTVDALDDLD